MHGTQRWDVVMVRISLLFHGASAVRAFATMEPFIPNYSAHHPMYVRLCLFTAALVDGETLRTTGYQADSLLPTQ